MRQRRRPAKVRPKTPARIKRRKRVRRARGSQYPELIGLALATAGVFLAVVLWLGWDGGLVGDKVALALHVLTGRAAAILPAVLLAVGGLMLLRSEVVDLRPFRTGLLVLSLALLLAFGGDRFGLGPGGPVPRTLDPHIVDDRGGVLGAALYLVARTLLGQVGTTLLALFGLIVGGSLISGASVGALLRRWARASKRVAQHTARASGRVARETVRAARRPPRAAPVTAGPAQGGLIAPRRSAPLIDAVRDFADVVGAAPAGDRAGAGPVLVEQIEPPPEDTLEVSVETGLLQPSQVPDYRLPDKELLRRSRPADGPRARAAERTAEVLVETLAHFGIEVTVVGQVAGPRVTRYELQLAPGTKVSRVAARKDDLAYALATTEIRILAPIPGKQAVGVEVPNVVPNLVTLGDIFDDLPATASQLAVWLGKDISGAAVWTDLARMPHILIAGTTGSGKSGCINTMICSILLRATPDEVRMILIDPKRVELGLYESIPHLLTPVVSSPKRAAAVFANVVEEMDARYERMSLVRARNLTELNRALVKRGEPPLPYLLVVIDELADLMMISPQEVEDAVIRLAQKSRAVGIHLVLATQRPSVDVITGMIKANVPSRIAFAVSSQTDSRVILDASGAETLLGQGDMLFKPLGTSRLQRVQGAYVSEEEIALIVDQCRSQRAQELDESLLEPRPAPDADSDDEEDLDPDEDPLLERAIEVVVQTQTASVSLIQRRLRVGYTRAGRLIDMLERRGIISGYEGSKPRRVLVGGADLDRALANLRQSVPG